jgi:hypothetical protein
MLLVEESQAGLPTGIDVAWGGLDEMQKRCYAFPSAQAPASEDLQLSVFSWRFCRAEE